MRSILTGGTPGDSALYFGLERYLAVDKRWTEPVFLLWRTRPTIMLGRYQDVYEEVDLDYVRAGGIQLVRRASGGGAIYTDPGSFQFSYIAPDAGDEIDFKLFVEPLIRALRELDLPAEFNGRNDLVLNGRKFCGNAQYRCHGYTVHHGSILFDADLTAMERATRLPDYKIRSKAVPSVRARVCNLREALRTDMTVQAFGSYLRMRLGGEMILTLAKEDWAAAEGLAVSFRDETSIFEKSPAATASRSRQFSGGFIRAIFELRQGRIDGLALSGDFFSAAEEPGALERTLLAALRGLPFEDGLMSEVLNALPCQDNQPMLYKITWADLKRLLTGADDLH